ncbi:MAG: 30S ribosomal protein S6 [Nitrospina sp.]|nr:30S ribosomal protein S6 [Nitrospina sp.]MBT3415943.1 30S ribosomal protein S6 [Nitrospina sp.]MBT3856332.1 30S ribosomal protein S6 [Nitrospina sp.]MBT4105636.1 30S ribosomal protein S6 [Nitrospina sp.]MBT4390288.1 30S ribosomal protein S6 [Nitrospina sp.]
MRSYQSVLILKPDIDEARADEALEKIGEFIKSNGGACLKIEKWGKKRLAYRIRKNRFGIYLNIYHTLDSANVTDLESKYRLFDLVIKFMVLRLTDGELERALDTETAEDEEGKEGEEGSAKVADKEDKDS